MTHDEDIGPAQASVELSDQALDWVVRLHSGAATPADHRAWQEWKGKSPDHAAAAREAEAIWYGLGSAATTWERKKHRQHMTRRALIGGGAATVVGAIGLNQLGLLGTHLLAEYQTATGERRDVRLQDGTRVMMNARSAMSGNFDGRLRGATLHRGQAFFRIGPDAARPFMVRAGGAVIQCPGGEIDVDCHGGYVTVTVLEGEAALTGPAGAIQLSADQRVRVADAAGKPRVETVNADEESAWRRGRLIFNRRSLADLAVELERYRGGRIVIMGSRLASMEMTGTFELADPEGILDSIAVSLPVRINRMPLFAIIREA